MLHYNWLDFSFFKMFSRVVILVVIIAFLLVNVETVISLIAGKQAFKYLIHQFNELSFYLNFLGALLLLVIWNGIYFTYYFFNKAYFKELDNLKLQSSQNEIELKNLKSQLNPHFLFNSLNSIKALIEIDPTLAKDTLMKLSNLLRNSLILGKRDTVLMQEELAIVKNYLELEKIRFDERLTIDIVCSEELLKVEIPPFIIQTLVENAIKHGISKEINGGVVQVIVKAVKHSVQIKVSNTGQLKASVTDTGIGVANTKRRLHLMYKEKAKFKLYEEEGQVVSEISIQDIV